MNKNIRKKIYLAVLTNIILTYSYNIICSLGPVSTFLNLDQIAQPTGFVVQLEKEIEGLQKRKHEQLEVYSLYKSELEQAKANLNNLREKAKNLTGVDLDFSNKYVLILNQVVQVFTEIEQLSQQIISIIDSDIKLLQEYKEDPEFKHKNLHIPSKSIYSIDDLQRTSDLLLRYDNEIKSLEERAKKTLLELDNRRKTLMLFKQEYEEKKKEQKELKSKDATIKNNGDLKKYTLKQRGELLDIQEKLLHAKKELAELRVKELEHRQQFIEAQIKTAKLQFETIEKEYDRVKHELRIEEKDVEQSEIILKQQVQDSTRNQDEYKKKIDALDLVKVSEANLMSHYKEKYKLSDFDIEAIGNWTYQPATIQAWASLIEIGRLSNHITYELGVNKDYLEAQIDIEKAKITEKEIDNLFINSWYKIVSGKFNRVSLEEINKEIKQYEKAKADIQASISSTIDQRAIASNILNNNIKITENIKARIRNFKDQKDTVFKDYPNEYNQFAMQLKDEISNDVPRRSENISQLIESYNSVSNLLKDILNKIDTMINEFKIKIQHLNAPMLWKGLQSFIPDIQKFIKFISKKSLMQYAMSIKHAIGDQFMCIKENPSSIIAILLQIIIAILLFMLLRFYLPDIKSFLEIIGPQLGSVGNILCSFVATAVGYIFNNLSSIYIWSILFFIIKYQYIKDIHVGILFYLISILFWLFYAHKYILYLSKFNEHKDYIFASKKYQRRFLIVFSILAFASIIILFFREAFLLSPFHKSDVPNTLLALNFIILQISLICILSKEQILGLIPQTTALWQWLHDHVKKYYYLFLSVTIFIIVMSNPYVGYGSQFFYFISRLILILLLIPFFSVLHNQIKRFSGFLFFSSDGDISKERFNNSRTVYGILIIFSFLIFSVLMLVIAANIWGYPMGLQDIYDWLYAEIYPFNDPSTGKRVSVNSFLIARVFLYIFIGVIVAYLVNRLILRSIFDLLLVNIGVQNAILSLTRYSIIIAAIIIALQSIGMSSSLLYIFAVIGGLGVAGKEIVTDFIGYFIILVQRPIKIGDLIRIDDDVNGIVRHITLRSVIIRRKNSVTLIVPNSQIMTRPVVNWNYTRSFFAFEDILLTTPYSSDPSLAKELILKVLDNNINILKNPAPIVWLREFTDNGFQFMVRGFLSPDKVLEQWEISSDIRLELVRVLRANGIEVASPTRIVKFVDKGQLDFNN